MARRIQVTGYLTSDELEARYRRAKGGVERSQWQMLWLLSSGKGSAEVAEVTGYCQDWIRKLVQRYNAQGEQAVGDKRRGHATPHPRQRRQVWTTLRGGCCRGAH